MKKSKVLLTLMCAVALVVTSVFGTLAYLQDTDEVVNTFTVGKVAILLDEKDVDGSETNVTTEGRDKANAYLLMPGHEYEKDPTVHVDADSESCYVFVKVENGIADIEAASVEGGYQNIAAQIDANGWTALEGEDNVFYQAWEKDESSVDLQVFAEFQIDGAVTNEQIAQYSSSNITVTAYAVQQDTFANAKAAWDAAGFDQQ